MNQGGDWRGGAPPQSRAGINRLLLLLDEEDRTRLLPAMTRVQAERDEVLARPGERVPAFFPCDGAVASLGVLLPDGRFCDVTLLGSETLLPVASPAFAQIVVRVPGVFLRLEADQLNAAATASPRLRDVLARVAEYRLAELMRTIACNIHHDLSSRLCRWLLAVRDRQADGRVALTQDYLARLLGVQRTTVSAAAAALAGAGVIRYVRGNIEAPDRAALEAAACPCHAAIRAHSERLLPGAWPPQKRV